MNIEPKIAMRFRGELKKQARIFFFNERNIIWLYKTYELENNFVMILK